MNTILKNSMNRLAAEAGTSNLTACGDAEASLIAADATARLKRLTTGYERLRAASANAYDNRLSVTGLYRALDEMKIVLDADLKGVE